LANVKKSSIKAFCSATNLINLVYIPSKNLSAPNVADKTALSIPALSFAFKKLVYAASSIAILEFGANFAVLPIILRIIAFILVYQATSSFKEISKLSTFCLILLICDK
jgi:hypothetical protein